LQPNAPAEAIACPCMKEENMKDNGKICVLEKAPKGEVMYCANMNTKGCWAYKGTCKYREDNSIALTPEKDFYHDYGEHLLE
jgi:hypothetical protein